MKLRRFGRLYGNLDSAKGNKNAESNADFAESRTKNAESARFFRHCESLPLARAKQSKILRFALHFVILSEAKNLYLDSAIRRIYPPLNPTRAFERGGEF
ncbi:hypothetical protein ACWIUD_04665 [Helicobacter sp. 23-1044]